MPGLPLAMSNGERIESFCLCPAQCTTFQKLACLHWAPCWSTQISMTPVLKTRLKTGTKLAGQQAKRLGKLWTDTHRCSDAVRSKSPAFGSFGSAYDPWPSSVSMSAVCHECHGCHQCHWAIDSDSILVLIVFQLSLRIQANLGQATFLDRNRP